MGAAFAGLHNGVDKVGTFLNPEADNLGRIKDFAGSREVPINQSVLPNEIGGAAGGFTQSGGSQGSLDLLSPAQIKLRRAMGGALGGFGKGLRDRQQQQDSQPYQNPYSDFTMYFRGQ